MSPIAVPPYPELLEKALAQRESTIPDVFRLPKNAFPLPTDVSTVTKDSGILDQTELAIIDLSATQLRDAIRAKTYTAVQTAMAYCKAAAIAQQTTNCLVELFTDEALERAKWLDETLERTGEPVGPLHGVPVSIKDHINVKGHDSPSGFLSLVGHMYAEEDAHMVSVLREAGAVFFVKTTNPQSLMHLETSCYFGATVNPFNTALTSGGSSGGEGALIGMKGSCLGIGTDIGGSIRSPAAACGIYGFKPSVARLPPIGCNMPVGPAGYEGIICTHGPMGRSPEDLELYMKILADSKPWLRDPYLQVKPWRPVDLSGKKIRIGVLATDGVVKPTAPIQRALNHAIERLRASDRFELVEMNLIRSKEAWELISQLYWPDSGAEVLGHIADSGEPIQPLTEWILSHVKGKRFTLEDSLALVARRDNFRAELAKHWQSYNVDVCLAPVGATPAPKLTTAKYWNYTSYWNLANYPAAVFPTGLFVDPKLDDKAYEATNPDEAWIKETFDAKVSVGAPLSLQLIGYIGHEEQVLAALKEVVKAL